jgi:zinc transport system substrate-binding protein
MLKRLYLIPIFIVSFVTIACTPQGEQVEHSAVEPQHEVWVSILPQQTIVSAVAGDAVKVEVMVRPGQSPETYSPSVPQMAALAKSDLYLGIGMPLERSIIAKAAGSMPQLHFVQTADLVEHSHVHHEDGHVEHAHGDIDPHVWMDPVWMLDFVVQVRDALIELDPSSAEIFTTNAEAVCQQLKDVDAIIRQKLQPYEGRCFYINHPSLGHFAEHYGLVQKSIEHAGSAPSAKQIGELVQSAKAEQVGAIFTQPEFGQSSADVLARALGVKTIEVDVLSGDYFSNLLDLAQSLEDSFK